MPFALNATTADSTLAIDERSNPPDSVNASAEANDKESSSQPTPEQDDSIESRRPIEDTQFAVNPITGLVPVTARGYTPMTGKQRWKVYWKQTYLSMGAYFKPVLFALVLDQAENSPRQWGGGLSGYGLRLASRTGSNIIQSTIRAPLAAALHEDVRYVYSGQSNPWRRTLYGAEYSFLTYNNQHRPTLNIAKLIGYYAATAISTQWRPPSKRSLGEYTLINGTEQLGLSVPINVLQEFWPSITRRLTRRQ